MQGHRSGPEEWKKCTTTSCPCPNHQLPLCVPNAPLDGFHDDPAFHHLTRTNHVPLLAEETSIRSSISEIRANHSVVCKSLSELQALRTEYELKLKDIGKCLKILISEKQDLSHSAIQRHRVLSPARRVPSEIWTLIFLSSVHEWQDASDSGETVLWRIERVCKTWRALALSSPHLWSFVTIHAIHTKWQPNSRYLPRIARHLSRSQTRPLFINIFSDVESTEPPRDLVILLLSVATRIQELRLEVRKCFVRALSQLEHHLDSLQCLIIDSPTRTFDDRIAVPIPIFAQCPQLQVFHTSNITSPTFHFTIPWHNILHYSNINELHINGAKPRQIVNVLAQAQILQRISVYLSQQPHPVTLTPVACNHLSSLTIHILPVSSDIVFHPLIDIFQHLELPCLDYLHIFAVSKHSNYAPPNPKVFTSIVDAIERSHSPIETIALPPFNIIAEDAIRLIRVAPALQDLRLCTGPFAGISDDKPASADTAEVPLLRFLALKEPLPVLNSLVSLEVASVPQWRAVGPPKPNFKSVWLNSFVHPSSTELVGIGEEIMNNYMELNLQGKVLYYVY